MIDQRREDVDARSSMTASGKLGEHDNTGIVIKALDLLTEQQCAEVRSVVHELRPHWVQRHPLLPFYTLGAASYLDAPNGNGAIYYTRAMQYNSLLRERFHWLYDRLVVVLADELRAPVVYSNQFALPGFHVFLATNLCEQPVAAIHRDLHYRLLHWDSPDEIDVTMTISFTLAIALPEAGGGLNVWDLRPWDLMYAPGHTLRELIRGSKKTYFPYQPGRLMLQRGDVFHQIAPTPKVQPEDERITLQGHGVRYRGLWHLYW